MGWQVKSYEFIIENDAEHRAELNRTGFWGKQGAGCIILAKDTGRICLPHRSQYVEQPGTWGTWGGAIDSGEDPRVAAARELREEAGYDGKLKLLPLYVFRHPSGFTYYNFLALVDSEFEPKLDWETQGYRWVEWGDWPTPLHNGLKMLLNDPDSVDTIKKYINPENIEEGWRDWAAGAAIGAAALGGAHHIYNKANPQEPAKPVVQQVKQLPTAKIFSPLGSNPQNELLLVKFAKSAGITGTELAQFLAQTKHESWDFTKLKEKAKGKNYFAKKYDIKFSPRMAKILGNTRAGDGEKYHGRGFIQLTGKDNYFRAGQALNLPLIDQPELAANPEIAAKIAIWYWNTKVKPHVDDFTDTTAVTRRINAGLRGLEDRHDNFKEYSSIL